MKTIYTAFISFLFNAAVISQSGTLDKSFGDSGIIYNPIIASAKASDYTGNVAMSQQQ